NTVTNCATLSVAPPPTITSNPANQIAPMGNTATFTVGSTSVVASTFQWLVNGSPISGANSSSVTVGPVTLADNGNQYQAVVSNCSGSTTSAVAVLSVYAIAGVSFDFNTPGQFTNIPNMVSSGNDWLSLNNGAGAAFPLLPVPVVLEQAFGGVNGSGALDPMNVDLTIMDVAHRYDLSLPGKTIYASTIVKLTTPTSN